MALLKVQRWFGNRDLSSVISSGSVARGRDGLLRLLVLFLVVSVSACTSDLDGITDRDSQDPDPVVSDIAIAYIKRPLPENGLDARTPYAFNPGAELLWRDQASPSSDPRNLSQRLVLELQQQLQDEADAAAEEAGEEPQAIAELLYDVKDLEPSFDGTKLLFAFRMPEIEDADDDEQPTWNIWEYDRESDQLRRIIESEITAETGQDFAPHYLPDGRIVFVSTRQRRNRAILLDEGKPQYSGLTDGRTEEAAVLHVMEPDGSDIKQISFNQSHDLDPIVMPSGHIIFSRWDNKGNHNSMNLYRTTPDGRDMQLIYGRHSHDTGTGGSTVQFRQPRYIADEGYIVAQLQPYAPFLLGGDMIAVDWQQFSDHNQAGFGVGNGSGQWSLALDTVRTNEAISPHGRFSSVYPLPDGTGRFLVSWSQCRLTLGGPILACTPENRNKNGIFEASPLYGIWVYDLNEESQLPVVAGEEGIMFTDVVAMAELPAPTVLADPLVVAEPDPGAIDQVAEELVDQQVGVIHIRSVYDIGGVDTADPSLEALADPLQATADERPARFIRLSKAVSIPDDDVRDFAGSAFGPSGQGMREILGYVPVEPDGSVRVKVPADVAFAVTVLDSAGRRIGNRHHNWMQVRAGEVVVCNGCHTPTNEVAHGRLDLEPPSVNEGSGGDGQTFPNTKPEVFAERGETMAEARTRTFGIPLPSFDIEYEDYWTFDQQREPDAAFAYRYSDLQTAAPLPAHCANGWSPECRISIQYVDHIQPLWDLPRQILDPVDESIVLEDRTCVLCHGPRDEAGEPQVPAAQVDLTGGASTEDPDVLTSYRDLLFTDNVQEIRDGALQDLLVEVRDGNGNVIFETDDDGNLLLDEEGNPIPRTQTVPIAAVINSLGANSSSDFFRVFNPGQVHDGWLSGAELKLLSEWIDPGAQYYNDPFLAPED